MTSTDDVPWPELGNVSRGATRGNQGQKGVLGPPDEEGRSIIQLRVQPGVLQVRLNRQSTQRYNLLASEVNRALKLTKTFWRKARRRQDYDARADQDHMELHEWLQQLKDKTMSHLELLMQKGDITGPPYAMPDDMELTFLRKFVERHAAGVPHNPRLRNGDVPRGLPMIRASLDESPTPEHTDGYYQDVNDFSVERDSGRELASSSRTSISPLLHNMDSMGPDGSPNNVIQVARMALAQAQKHTQEALMRYSQCVETERHAQQSLDDIMSNYVSRQPGPDAMSGRSSAMDQRPPSPSRYDKHQRLLPNVGRPSRPDGRTLDWGDGSQGTYPHEAAAQFDHSIHVAGRKHARDWYLGGDLTEEHYSNDLDAPRKRAHRGLIYDVNQLIPPQPHGMTMHS